MKLIMNSAMVPNDGTFNYRLISQDQAITWLKANPSATSYIGYQQTADHLHAIAGVTVAVNRAVCFLDPGDEAFICKLAYRIDNPATKGAAQKEDWQYGILSRLA